MKVKYADRVPPGDRWKIVENIYDSLTACLNDIFLETSTTYFEVDAVTGEVYIDDGKEPPKVPPKTWDLYGEKNN